MGWTLRETTEIPPLRAVYAGDLPAEAGLASSAALEVATAAAWLSLAGHSLARSASMEMARLCHRAEKEFVGVPCGLMDQAAAALGRQGHALYLDCRDQTFVHVPLPANTSILVFDTGVSRQLRSGQLRQRRLEGQRAVEILRAAGLELDALRDLSRADLDRLPKLPVSLFRRVRHVVGEIARVQEATAALQAGDLAGFGQLMVASHRSSAEDYESTIDELDYLVAVAADRPGCYGARVTGAGFGGAVVALVDSPRSGDVIAEVAGAYRRRFGREPEVERCISADGLVFG